MVDESRIARVIWAAAARSGFTQGIRHCDGLVCPARAAILTIAAVRPPSRHRWSTQRPWLRWYVSVVRSGHSDMETPPRNETFPADDGSLATLTSYALSMHRAQYPQHAVYRGIACRPEKHRAQMNLSGSCTVLHRQQHRMVDEHAHHIISYAPTVPCNLC
jgi:hypothetical protein